MAYPVPAANYRGNSTPRQCFHRYHPQIVYEPSSAVADIIMTSPSWSWRHSVSFWLATVRRCTCAVSHAPRYLTFWGLRRSLAQARPPFGTDDAKDRRTCGCNPSGPQIAFASPPLNPDWPRLPLRADDRAVPAHSRHCAVGTHALCPVTGEPARVCAATPCQPQPYPRIWRRYRGGGLSPGRRSSDRP